MGKTREIIARAIKDPAFCERLLKDAKSTINQEFGFAVPEGVTVRVHENSPTVINLVLPAQADAAAGRSLSDRELEQVAGGLARRTGANAISPWI